MPRSLHIPSVLLLFAAFSLLFLVSISLPWLPSVDFVRVHFEGSPSTGEGNRGTLSELRYGIWAYCWYETSGLRSCSPIGHGYPTTVFNADKSSWQSVGASWTRGLAVHPSAAALAFVALLLSLSTHITVALFAALFSFLAAVVTLTCFAIDIALYAFVKHQMGRINGVSETTHAGPAFWMTFVSFVLISIACCTVCCGRRRDRMSGATSYPLGSKVSWRDRFRR